MLDKIKKNIEDALQRYTGTIARAYGLKDISPLLHNHIINFLGRPGKRIRPLLFVLSYLGYCRRPAAGLYDAALGLELLHAFLLIHDDIIDKSMLRKGQPALHTMFDQRLKNARALKFNGSDMALVAGDIIYAMAVDVFLSIRERPEQKLKALKQFLRAAINTGCGEFVELESGMKSLPGFQRKDIDIIYDLKTAYYTFCSPLTIGALLAGAQQTEINKLTRYGLLLGRAFQIKDDMLDMFGTEAEIGKSPLTDIKEGKKTLLILEAFRKTGPDGKKRLQRILGASTVRQTDLDFVRRLVISTGALDAAKHTIAQNLAEATRICASLRLRPAYRELLLNYPQKILKV